MVFCPQLISSFIKPFLLLKNYCYARKPSVLVFWHKIHNECFYAYRHRGFLYRMSFDHRIDPSNSAVFAKTASSRPAPWSGHSGMTDFHGHASRTPIPLGSGMIGSQNYFSKLAQPSTGSSYFQGAAASRGPLPKIISEPGGPAVGTPKKSFANDWAHSTAMYGLHTAASEMINKVADPQKAIGKQISNAHQSAASKLGFSTTVASEAAKGVSYSELLHLGQQQTNVHQVTWNAYKKDVQANLSEFKKRIKPGSGAGFFDTSPKNYLKNTVWRLNIDPSKQLIKNSHNKELGTSLFRTAAVGLLGYDVYKHTADAYTRNKALEDGTWKSKWCTCRETAKAFGKYSFRDGASWEVAGVGAAVGKALVPIALGGISLGGIAVGALAGVAAEKCLDHALKTGDQDPNEHGPNSEINDAQESSRSGPRR
jgi:hypothetical protein